MVRLSKKAVRKYTKQGYDLDFLQKVQPKGNINFKPDLFYYGGDGYYTVLHVVSFPTKGLPNFWLRDLMQVEGTRAFLSVVPLDSEDLKKQITKAIEEKSSRVSGKRKQMDNQQEFDEIAELTELHRQIQQLNISMKGIYVRLFVVADTEEGLQKRVKEIKDKSSAYKMTVLAGELDFEYESPFVLPSAQKSMENRRRPTVIRTYDLAGGYFFNHTKLEDEHGTYFGWTPTNGAVNFNFLERDNKRTTSFMLISGSPKQGQTTFALKLNDDLYSKGNYIRNFDVDGMYREQTRRQHGLILDLSGSQNRINPFQVFPTVTSEDGSSVDEERSFQVHIEKLKNIFKLMSNALTDDDLSYLNKALINFYIEKGIWYRNPQINKSKLRATKIRQEEYPVLSDFNIYIQSEKVRLANQRNTDPVTQLAITRIESAIDTMQSSYAGIFEGVTQFQNISAEKVVTFDFSALTGEPAVLNAQIFSVLTLLSADITNNGKRCRKFLKDHRGEGYKETDLPHYIVNMSAAQSILKPEYRRSVDLLASLMDGMSNSFAGMILNISSLVGIVGESTSLDNPYTIAIQRIFGLMQYRVFARSAEEDITRLARALAGQMTKSELSLLGKMNVGQLFMNIAGVGNIFFTQQLIGEEVRRYGSNFPQR